ncbi:MAG: hypothetical protein QOD83_2477 [Solirubrobacteraceae bacterium]|jgi:hypothetical protein|nr:hypothetical protein [Solirubrobacteraceae bacterium]
MDLAFLLAAAEHAAEEHHKSELPFFIAGGLLVAFAIIISVVGFKKPEFPANDQAARGVMALSVALVAGALGSAIYVAL